MALDVIPLINSLPDLLIRLSITLSPPSLPPPFIPPRKPCDSQNFSPLPPSPSDKKDWYLGMLHCVLSRDSCSIQQQTAIIQNGQSGLNVVRVAEEAPSCEQDSAPGPLRNTVDLIAMNWDPLIRGNSVTQTLAVSLRSILICIDDFGNLTRKVCDDLTFTS